MATQIVSVNTTWQKVANSGETVLVQALGPFYYAFDTGTPAIDYGYLMADQDNSRRGPMQTIVGVCPDDMYVKSTEGTVDIIITVS